jgi:hypothetical protein
MKQINFLRTMAFAVLLGSTITTMNSCKDDEETSDGNELGTITGTVTDEDAAPIEGVTVAVSGVDGTTATGSDGKYTVANVTIETHTVNFSKTGWLATSTTVAASKFDANKVATVNATLQNASARIEGTVTDATNSNAPLADVSVSVGTAGSATTGSDGKYVIENLIADDYTATFSKEGYPSVERSVTSASFVSGVATVDVEMGLSALLPGKTAVELRNADKWYFDEYRGGKHGDAYPHWDWSSDFMCTLDFWGNFEEQNEGSTLRIRNDDDQRGNPANLNVFDSYVYGSKNITDGNKILSLRVRTHGADADAPAYFGVQVVDLSAATPAAEKVGETKTHGSGDYADYDFDLSAYVGKEVVVAVGIYRQQTGDYWKQLVLRRIAFAPQKAENWDWLPGTDVAGLEGWHMTQEMVRSMMPNPNKSFTGISPVPSKGSVDNDPSGFYWDAYTSWRTVNHVATNWFFVPVVKDPEPFAGEGFIIKTRGDAPINTTVPEAYFAAKFAIAAGNNQLTLKTRNFGDNYTFFKLTAITEAGVVTHIAPTSNTAEEAEAADNGCWKFKHGSGGAGNPDDYASFVYDLSQLNGSSVVLCLGVFKGESNGDENKLCFYSINLE